MSFNFHRWLISMFCVFLNTLLILSHAFMLHFLTFKIHQKQLCVLFRAILFNGICLCHFWCEAGNRCLISEYMHYLRPFGCTSLSQHLLRQKAPADPLRSSLQCVAGITDRSLLAIMLSDGRQWPSLHLFHPLLLRKRCSIFFCLQNDQKKGKSC